MKVVYSVLGAFIAIVVLSQLAVNLFPTIVTNFGNVSTIANNPIATLFANNGVLTLILFIGLFVTLVTLVLSYGKTGKMGK